MSDTDYNGTYFFVPANVLSEIYPEKKNFIAVFVINAHENISIIQGNALDLSDFVTCHTLTNHYADWSGGCT
ncbi:hypothetical protein C824_005204 [Schaedlerella arabinosiphila]|jgi:hypothetical protein|nr:hypothetical protein C824_005204 [Schaedlerella arabinosiphila]